MGMALNIHINKDTPNNPSRQELHQITTQVKFLYHIPDSKVHGANMGPTRGLQDPGGPHIGPMNYLGCHLKYVEGSFIGTELLCAWKQTCQ